MARNNTTVTADDLSFPGVSLAKRALGADYGYVAAIKALSPWVADNINYLGITYFHRVPDFKNGNYIPVANIIEDNAVHNGNNGILLDTRTVTKPWMFYLGVPLGKIGKFHATLTAARMARYPNESIRYGKATYDAAAAETFISNVPKFPSGAMMEVDKFLADFGAGLQINPLYMKQAFVTLLMGVPEALAGLAAAKKAALDCHGCGNGILKLMQSTADSVWGVGAQFPKYSVLTKYSQSELDSRGYNNKSQRKRKRKSRKSNYY